MTHIQRISAFVLYCGLVLTACRGSFSHKYDNLKRLCATTEEGALPLVSQENGRLQAWAEVKSLADFKTMAIRIVKGTVRPELTAKGCYIPHEASPEAVVLITDRNSQSYAVVDSQSRENVIMKSWSRSVVSANCSGRQFASDRINAPLLWSPGFDSRALGIRIQAKVENDGRIIPLFEKEPGDLWNDPMLSFPQSGLFQLETFITDPFGYEYPLSDICRYQVIRELPSALIPADVLDPENEAIILKTGKTLTLTLSDFAQLRYCYAPLSQDPCTQITGEGPIRFEEAGTYLLRYVVKDPAGRESSIVAKKVFVSPVQPELKLKWDDPLFQKFTQTMALPQVNYRAQISFHEKNELAKGLKERLSCRVSLKKSANEVLLGNFAVCDSKECRGQRLNRFVPCGASFGFHLDVLDGSSINRIDWRELIDGGLVLEVQARDELGSTDQKSLALPSFKVANFPKWDLSPLPDGATSVVSTLVLGQTLFVRLSYDKLYRVSLDNLQEWQEVSLEETSKDFDRMIVVNGKIWLMSRLQIFEGTGDGHWVKKSPKGLDDPSSYNYSVAFARYDASRDLVWIGYSQGMDTRVIGMRSDGSVAPFPCSLAGLKGPEGDDLPREWTEVHAVGDELYLLQNELYLKASRGSCGLTYLPEYEADGYKSRRYSLRVTQDNHLLALRPNGVLRLDQGVFRDDEKMRRILDETNLRKPAAFLNYVETRAGNLITTDTAGQLNLTTFGSDGVKLSVFNDKTMGLTRDDDTDFWIFDTHYIPERETLIVVSKWGLLVSTPQSSAWKETGFSFSSNGILKDLKAIGQGQLIWIADRTSLADASGVRDLSVGSRGESIAPEALGWDRDGTLIVAGITKDVSAGKPQRQFYRINTDGTLVQTDELGPYPIGLQPHEQPTKFTVDADGRVWMQIFRKLIVAEAGNISTAAYSDGSNLSVQDFAWDDERKNFIVLDSETRRLVAYEKASGFKPLESPLQDITKIMGMRSGFLAYGTTSSGLPALYRFKHGNWDKVEGLWDFTSNPLREIFTRDDGGVCVIGQDSDYACQRGDVWDWLKTEPWPLDLKYSTDAKFASVGGSIVAFFRTYGFIPQSLYVLEPSAALNKF